MVEIHITTQPLNPAELEKFLAFCKENNFKPILIELDQGDTMQQPMISKAVEVENEHRLNSVIYQLERLFYDAGFKVLRLKKEIPLDFYDTGKWYHTGSNKYFEYHAKLKFPNENDLLSLKQLPWVHISRNALKGEPDRRFVTYRHYGTKDEFLELTAGFKREFEARNLLVIKEEFEYCIYDSAEKIDNGWLDKHGQEEAPANLNLIALEGFLRRASLYNEGFVLKGSMLTRQYFSDKNVRNVRDIDFIYKYKLTDNPAPLFSNWAKRVTETHMDDDLEFRSFSQNDFWKSIDYAMHDDFPTTNTHIDCLYKGVFYHRFNLDISWNLPLEEELVPIQYEPVHAKPFVVDQTIPVSTQISWKLHQTMVRPRVKDLVDIILILQHVELSKVQVNLTLYHFIQECLKDKIPVERLKFFTNKQVSQFYSQHYEDIMERFQTAYEYKTPFGFNFEKHFDMGLQHEFYSGFKYWSVADILNDFEDALIKAGIVLS